ncbi:MAG: hypothetical protein ACN4GG_03155 [Akkermansiaceae bacterium]
MAKFAAVKLTSIFALISALTGLASGQLKIGAALPKVEAQSHLGKTVKIEAKKGDDYILVFFYPKALTGG